MNEQPITELDIDLRDTLAERIENLNVSAEVQIELAVKTRDAATILAAASALHELGRPALLGHNRIQEAIATIPAVRATGTHLNVAMIGPLQTNKINQMLRVCDELATVDHAALVDALAPRTERAGHDHFPVWVQVNVSGESSKSGCLPEQAAQLVDRCEEAGLAVQGLMTVGLNSDDFEAVAKGYRLLAQLRDQIALDYPHVQGLSMGMSGDYELAIGEGATRVRLGTTVFGPRPAR